MGASIASFLTLLSFTVEDVYDFVNLGRGLGFSSGSLLQEDY